MAIDTQRQELLRKAECFAHLDESSLHLLETKMTTAAHAGGDVICEEGDAGDWMFVVESGRIAVVKKAEDGTPIQIAELGPGDFGGMMSLFEREPRSATLQAKEPVRLLLLGHDTFQRLLETSAPLAMGMLAFLSKRLRRGSRNLAATLRYVSVSGLDYVYAECSPEERLILDAVNQKVAAAESLDAVMDFVFDSVTRMTACDRLDLAFVEDGGSRLVAHWSRSDREPLVLAKGYAWDLKDQSLVDLLESGRPGVINDLEAYVNERPDAESARLLLNEGLRSSMACPLSVDGRPVGFLFRSSRTLNAYDEHQVRLHLAIAERLSQAVEKAYRIEQLDAANQAYFEMLGFVTHELKSPLASAVMDGNLLVGGYLGELEEQQRAKVQRMIDKSKYLLGLVGDYLNLARLESGRLTPHFSLEVNYRTEILEPAIEIVSPQIDARGMKLTCEFDSVDLPVQCAPDLLKVAVVNLLSNAVKYGFDNGAISLRSQCSTTGIGTQVRNEGPGFPPEERSKLFRKFSRIRTPELLQQKGTGVGLYTTWRIIQSHQGRVDATSELGKWAEFSFEIPQPLAT